MFYSVVDASEHVETMLILKILFEVFLCIDDI